MFICCCLVPLPQILLPSQSYLLYSNAASLPSLPCGKQFQSFLTFYVFSPQILEFLRLDFVPARPKVHSCARLCYARNRFLPALIFYTSVGMERQRPLQIRTASDAAISSCTFLLSIEANLQASLVTLYISNSCVVLSLCCTLLSVASSVLLSTRTVRRKRDCTCSFSYSLISAVPYRPKYS
jgi:hypothetical protein